MNDISYPYPLIRLPGSKVAHIPSRTIHTYPSTTLTSSCGYGWAATEDRWEWVWEERPGIRLCLVCRRHIRWHIKRLNATVERWKGQKP